jgi:hypothetical protein
MTDKNTWLICNQRDKCDRRCTGDHWKPHKRKFDGHRDICAPSFCAYAHGAQATCGEYTGPIPEPKPKKKVEFDVEPPKEDA